MEDSEAKKAESGGGDRNKSGSVPNGATSEIEDEFRNQVHFSSATKSDNFTGGSVSDFIYGGGGNDIICADNYAAATAGRCAA